ncbi:CBS domain-containing protein [uncultured Methanocorpusculum sp.]|nr:CBS domain-containing protein [uncultured Methanocorpusculum sp.]
MTSPARQSKGKKNSVLDIASLNVISVPPTMSIIEGIQMMSRHNFRRLPITDPGTKKLIGIVTITDVIDMMGGGSRYNLIANKHKGNLLAALNESLREIATENVTGFSPATTVKEAANILLETGHGGFPILNPDSTIAGIVTEYDLMRMLAGTESELVVDEIMTPCTKKVSPDLPLSNVTKQIVDDGYRRLPVVKDGILLGMITATDIMGYLGNGRVFSEMHTGTVDEVLSLPVRDVMTASDIRTVATDMPISIVAQEMLNRGIGAFPVMDGGKLSGIVTEFDLVKALTGTI